MTRYVKCLAFLNFNCSWYIYIVRYFCLSMSEGNPGPMGCKTIQRPLNNEVQIKQSRIKQNDWEGAPVTEGFGSAQLLSHVQFFATPWIAACQASLSTTVSWSSLKLMSIESVMPAISSSVVPFSSCPQSLPASDTFPMSQLFAWGGQITLASVLPKNTQNWSPLEWTGWISLQSKGLSRVFSNTTVQKHQFFGTQLSL